MRKNFPCPSPKGGGGACPSLSAPALVHSLRRGFSYDSKKGKVIVLLLEVSGFGSEVPPEYWEKMFENSANYVKEINWAWLGGIIMPWFVWLTITAVIIVIVRTVVDKLIDKLTSKRRLKRDIEEAKYRRMIEELAQEELYNTKNSTRYSNPQSAKMDRNKSNRK